MNIIGDIAGQYDALMGLVDKMPNEEIILVGDLVDRGRNSKEVIQWAIDNDIKCCLGNHEHMMIDYYCQTNIYEEGVWSHLNGGSETISQYKGDGRVLKQHIEWLKSLPLSYKFDEVFISHAPWWPKVLDYQPESEKDLKAIIWNREKPRKQKLFQVFGHNSFWGIRWFFSHKNFWAVCVDDSLNRDKLTGLNYESGEIYQEPY